MHVRERTSRFFSYLAFPIPDISVTKKKKRFVIFFLTHLSSILIHMSNHEVNEVQELHIHALLISSLFNSSYC